MTGNMTGVLTRRNLDTDRYRGKMNKHSKKKAICKSRREASEETNSANALISDFSAPGLRECKLLSFKPFSVWYFVIANLAN